MKREISALFALAILALFATAGSAAAAGPNPVLSYLSACPVPAPQGQARCYAQVVTRSSGDVQAESLPSGYGPLQLQTAYGLPQIAPSDTQPDWVWNNQTIAIVDAFDDPTAEADLNTYSTAFGLPACTSGSGCFTKVNQNGGSILPWRNGGWALEISLDVQIAHAVCPYCKILLVEAANSSFFNLLTAEDYATSHSHVVSNSWGNNEFLGQNSALFDSHFDRPGVAISFATGDGGYGAEYPASSQFVTAVGGTTLNLNPDNTRASESVWARTGSGCSLYTRKPQWQTDPLCPRRTTADVSADADPKTGAAVYDSTPYCQLLKCSTGWFQVGGTSLSTPIIAGIYALAGNAGSTLYGSYPYAHSGSLFDVDSGRNGFCITYLCAGATGFDGPSGLGTPNGSGGF